MVITPRHLLLLSFVIALVGAGAFWEFDYIEMLGGDPVLLVLMAASIVFCIMLLRREQRWLYAAAGATILLVPFITLFLFGAVGGVADPADGPNFLGAVLYLVALGVGLFAAVQGYRQSGGPGPAAVPQ